MMSSTPKLWTVLLSLMMVSLMLVGVVALLEPVEAATNTSQLDFSPIYNQDVVYGTNDSTNGDFDGGSRSLPSSSAADAEGRPRDYGLPDDGVFAAETDVHPRFDLADFNSDDLNAWQTTGTGSKTVSVTNDQYETVHVIASAGGAGVGNPAKFELKIHYGDGSTETSQEFTAPDWYNDTYNPSGVYFLRDGMDRYSSTAGYQYENDPAIWGYAVSANSSKTLTEVTIDVTENQADAFNFFGGAATTQTSTETNNAPSASDDFASTDEDTSVTVDVVSNDNDPDGDSLDVDSITNAPSHGTAQITGSSSDKIEFTPGTDQNSDVDITYRVKDGNGGTDTATLSVTVNAIDDAPTVPDDSSQSTNEDSTVSVPDGDSADLLELASDPDAGDTLTISKIDGESFSDGKTVSLGSGATVTVNSDGSWSYDPNGQFEDLDAEDSTTDSYTYTIEDDDGDTDQGTVTLTINGQNDAPTGISLGSTTVAQSGGTNAVVGSFSSTDADSDDSHTYSLVSGPGDGDNDQFNINSGNLRTDDASSMAAGDYDVRMETADSNGATFEDTFTISVTDDVAPTLSSSVPADDSTGHNPVDELKLTFSEDIQFGSSGSITLNDIDGATTEETFDVTSDTGGGDGTVSISSDTLTINPTSNLQSSNEYAVQIDGTAIEDTASSPNSYAGISNNDDLDFTTADTDPSFTSGSSVSVTVDEDGSVDLTSELEATDISLSDTLTWSVESAPSNGGLSGVDGETLNTDGSNSPHTLGTSPTYTPNADVNGMDSFDVQIADTNPGSSTETITVSVTINAVNDAPSFSLPADPDQSVGNDTTQQTNSSFIDTATFDPGGGSDESTQSLSDFLVSNDNNTLFDTQPDIDNSGDLTYTPADSVEGTATVDVQVTDDGGTSNGGTDTSASKSFNITVDNREPSISSFSVSNPSGQDITISLDSDDQLSTINVSISGAEMTALTRGDFTETNNGGSYTYDATYGGSSDGDYTATLDAVSDTADNNGTSGHSDSVTVDTSSPSSGGGGGGGGSSPTTDDSETTVTVEGNTGQEEAGAGEDDETEDGEGDGATGDEPAPDIAVTVERPQPGQTLVIDGTSASIQEEEGDAEGGDTQDGNKDNGQDDGDDSQASDADSNVRADRLAVELDTTRNFELSITTYENDLTRSATTRDDAPLASTAGIPPRAGGVSGAAASAAVPQVDETLAPPEVQKAADSFESETETVSAGYVNVNHTLDPEEIAGATFEFSIRRAYLAELGVVPEDVELYHQTDDGEWAVRETEHIGSDDTHYRFEGTMSGFSVFALGTGASQVKVTTASLVESTVEVGEEATVSVTIENRGRSAVEETVELIVDRKIIDSETVTLDSGTTEEVTLSFSPDTVDEYDLAAGGIDLDPLTVQAAEDRSGETDESIETGESTDPNAEDTDNGLLLFGVGVVTICGVLLGIFLLRWRKNEEDDIGESPPPK